MMNKITIKNIVCCALAFILVLPFAVFNVGVRKVHTTGSFVSSLSPDENISFGGGAGFLTVTAKLGSKSAFVWLLVADKNDTVTDGIFETNQPAKLTIDVPNGTYTLSVYFGDERYGSYTSYFKGGDIKISVKGNSVTFTDSPVFTNNQKVYAGKRDDKQALDYYVRPSKGIESDSAAVIAIAKQITNGISDDYAKVKAVHDWVSGNIWYDFDAITTKQYNELTALETLSARKSVCQGYACLTAALLRSLNIPTKFIAGYSLGIGQVKEWNADIVKNAADNHAWNEAFVNNRWVIIDTTWDSANEWRGGKKDKNGGLRYSRYFDVTIDALSIDHKITEYDESVIHKAFSVPTTVPTYAVAAISALEKEYVVPETVLRDFDKPITRGETASALFGAYCMKDRDADSYKYNVELADVAAGYAYKNEVGAALYFKIMSVDTNNNGKLNFSPNGYITNQDLAMYLYNLDSVVKNAKPALNSGIKSTKYKDDDKIAAWAKPYADYVSSKGYFAATERFNPTANVTRQDALAAIYKLLVSAGLMGRTSF